MKYFFLLFFSALTVLNVCAQSDSASIQRPTQQRVYTHYDSVHLARLNSSGNLMIAGGIGLCAAGSYLIYQGNKVYTTGPSTNSTNPAEEINRNHKQGTIYYVAGGVGIAAGIILTAFGARNKVDFKTRKKMMEFESGILNNGNLGVALNF